jgi:hypothetical protein
MTIELNLDIEPIEHDGKHFVSLRTNGREWKREGPFADAVTARAAADRQIRRWRKAAMGNGVGVGEAAAGKPAPIPPRTIPADTTNSSNKPAKRSSKHKRSPARQAHPQTSNVASVPTTSSFLDDSELIEDLARYAENVLSEQEVRKRHRLTEKDWIAMAEDDDFVRRVDDRKLRRIRDGSTKRELAQKHVVRGPQVLATIMDDPAAHAKHKVDAIKTLDQLATPPGQSAGADTSRFLIQINIGGDVETYNKSRSIMVDDPHDVSTKSTVIDADDTGDIETTTLAIFAAKQNKDSGGGQNHI